MSHKVKLLRATVAARLIGHTDMGSRVATNRARQPWSGDLPAGLIYTRTVANAVHSRGERRQYLRTARVAVELFLEEIDGEVVDDQVDDLADQVEVRLRPAMWLPELAEVEFNADLCHFEGTEYDHDDEGERLLGAARLTFVYVFYDEDPSAEGLEVVPLTSVGVDIDLPPVQGVDAQDVVELEQP